MCDCPVTGHSILKVVHAQKYLPPKKFAMLVTFFELFPSRKHILLHGFHHYYKDTMNDDIFITTSTLTCSKWFAVEKYHCEVSNNT